MRNMGMGGSLMGNAGVGGVMGMQQRGDRGGGGMQQQHQQRPQQNMPLRDEMMARGGGGGGSGAMGGGGGSQMMARDGAAGGGMGLVNELLSKVVSSTYDLIGRQRRSRPNSPPPMDGFSGAAGGGGGQPLMPFGQRYLDNNATSAADERGAPGVMSRPGMTSEAPFSGAV